MKRMLTLSLIAGVVVALGCFGLLRTEAAPNPEPALVVSAGYSAMLESLTCKECAELAKQTCGDGFKSVACGANGSCSVTCKDNCGPQEE